MKYSSATPECQGMRLCVNCILRPNLPFIAVLEEGVQNWRIIGVICTFEETNENIHGLSVYIH
jgi:hypothetical protein